MISPRSGTTTIISCGNASGTAMPPFFVSKGKQWNADLLKGKSPGAAAMMSDSGWCNSSIFKSYLEEHFMTYAQRPRSEDQKLLILYDGHKSHVCSPLIEWARDNNIILFVLPPHCSNILQPLEIGCFSPMKAKFNQKCQLFMRQNPSRTITRFDICEACKAYLKGLSPTNLISAGAIPLNRTVISVDMLEPSTIMMKGPDENCHLTDTLKDSSETETNDERVEQTQTVNQFFKTKQVMKRI